VTAVRETIGAFLESDLTNLTTATIASTDVYRGQQVRNKERPLELRVAHVRRENLGSKTGKPRRHSFEIEVTSIVKDRNEEETQAALVSDVADEIVDRYDGAQGGLATLRAGLTALRLERSRCRRRRPAVVDRRNDVKRGVFVDLDLDVWE